MKKLLIFDASNYMFRAYFAGPKEMTNSAGFPTNALHFYTSMILAVIKRIHPDAIALAHEMRGPKFRHDLYPEYKGQREAPPEALQLQFPWFRQITDALGIPAYDAVGFEADDVVATLTKQARDMGWSVIIASSDKDLMQLVERKDDTDTVIMLDALKKPYQYFTIDDVLARFQVAPNRVADVLALAGDTADNIPGCKGIGEKTAGKLIAQYGSLEELMAHRSEITKPAQKANLEAFSSQAELSKKLTTLVYNVPVTLKIETMHPDPVKVTEIFSSLELHKLLSEVLGPDAKPNPQIPRVQLPGRETKPATEENSPRQRSLFDLPTDSSKENKEETTSGIPRAAAAAPIAIPALSRTIVPTPLCESTEELEVFLRNIRQIAISPIWTDDAPAHRELLGAAIAATTGALYLPINHIRELFSDPNGPRFESYLKKILMDTDLQKVVYDIKPFTQYLLQDAPNTNIPNVFDVEMAAYLVHPERKALSLEICSHEYLGYELQPLHKSCHTMDGLTPLQAAANASGPRAQLILQLAEKLPAELEANKLTDLFLNLDMPLAKILAKMEFYGVAIDVQALHQLSKTYEETLKRLDAEAHAFSTEPFNINSPKELAHFLYEVLKLVPATKKKSIHGLSTDQETLDSIDHPIAKIISEYRAASKLKSTYSEALAQLADPQTGRIHGRFNACVTATTRLSSSDPNLQNIPGRTELGRQIKRCFVAKPGFTFIGADYSQIELRLMAAFSKDPVLIKAYLDGEDVHARTAATLFEIPIEQVTKEQRRLAKTINFGLLYGMGVQKLARETGYPKTEAKAFLEKFHAQFPTLSDFFNQQIENAKEAGETRTLLGHRRAMPELYSDRPVERAFGERVATNAPIQGSASDIVKRAMIRLEQLLHEHNLHARLLIQVHDELLLECPNEEVEKTSQILIDAMENAANIKVPLRVELKTGNNWADMVSV
ncbi:MAG: DNA polymerase I [Proteobacteria bacterium]|nr:DNA polymerase I [Pseudomonadota bacterium]